MDAASRTSMSTLNCDLDTSRSRGSSQWIHPSSSARTSSGVSSAVSTTSMLGLPSNFRFKKAPTNGLPEATPSSPKGDNHPSLSKSHVPRIHSALALQQGSMQQILSEAAEESGYRPLMSTHTVRELHPYSTTDDVNELEYGSQSTADEHASSVSGVSESLSEAANVVLAATSPLPDTPSAHTIVPMRPQAGRSIRLAPLNLPGKRSSLHKVPMVAKLPALPSEVSASSGGDCVESSSIVSSRSEAAGPTKSFFGSKGNKHKVVPILAEDEAPTAPGQSRLRLIKSSATGFSRSTKALGAHSKRINLVQLSKGGEANQKLARIVGMFGVKTKVLSSLAGGLSPSHGGGNAFRTCAQAARAQWMRCWLRKWLVVMWAVVCRLAVPISAKCEYLMRARWFDRFIVACIVLNAISISSYYDGLSDRHEYALQVLEFIFSTIFTFGTETSQRCCSPRCAWLCWFV
jgi:hypothetical protein